MMKFRCTVCNYIYDEAKEGREFSTLTYDWTCPVCNALKIAFVPLSEDREKIPSKQKTVSDVLITSSAYLEHPH